MFIKNLKKNKLNLNLEIFLVCILSLDGDTII